MPLLEDTWNWINNNAGAIFVITLVGAGIIGGLRSIDGTSSNSISSPTDSSAMYTWGSDAPSPRNGFHGRVRNL